MFVGFPIINATLRPNFGPYWTIWTLSYDITLSINTNIVLHHLFRAKNDYLLRTMRFTGNLILTPRTAVSMPIL